MWRSEGLLAVPPQVLLVDQWIQTGGTMLGAIRLVEKLGQPNLSHVLYNNLSQELLNPCTYVFGCTIYIYIISNISIGEYCGES